MDVRDAIAKAKSYASAVFADNGAADFVVEEVEHDRARSIWFVTISFKRKEILIAENALAIALQNFGPRLSKIVKIDATSGEVISVTNRETGFAA